MRQRVHLQAAYIDTPSFDLAAGGLGWRVRREGRRWVQTLKADLPDGGDGLRREEHNVPVRSVRRPEPDAALHAGTAAGERLADRARVGRCAACGAVPHRRVASHPCGARSNGSG